MPPIVTRSSRAALLCLATAFLANANARAEDHAPGADTSSEGDGSEVIGAREAFVRGVELAKVGRWNEARAAFEESDRTLPHAVTKYNVGFCARALGLYARAEQAFA